MNERSTYGAILLPQTGRFSARSGQTCICMCCEQVALLSVQCRIVIVVDPHVKPWPDKALCRAPLQGSAESASCEARRACRRGLTGREASTLLGLAVCRNLGDALVYDTSRKDSCGASFVRPAYPPSNAPSYLCRVKCDSAVISMRHSLSTSSDQMCHVSFPYRRPPWSPTCLFCLPSRPRPGPSLPAWSTSCCPSA